MLVLANAVNQAWLRGRVVTLLAFDLKGVSNEVSTITLGARLRESAIPAQTRTWIHSFMQNWRVGGSFGEFETEEEAVEHAGLPQDSPLRPILFAFFNANLVDQTVDTRRGASAYIDDYFRWRVGESAEENLKKRQGEEWARRTQSLFAADEDGVDSPDTQEERTEKGMYFIE